MSFGVVTCVSSSQPCAKRLYIKHAVDLRGASDSQPLAQAATYIALICMCQPTTQASQQAVQRPPHVATQPAWHVPASLALAAAASLSLVATPVHAVSGGKGISSSLAFSDQTGADFRGRQLTKADLRGMSLSR